MVSIPATMKALVQQHDGYGQDPSGQRLETMAPFLALQDIAVPEPKPGEALVRVSRAAVNPSDVAFIKGMYGQPRRKGVAAGFEGCGTVVAGDTPLVGQRVSFFTTGTGSWAEYAITRAEGLVPLRPDILDEDAAGLIVNPITAAGMFELVKHSGAKSFIATAAASQLGKFLIALGAAEDIPCLAHIRRSATSEALLTLGAGAVLATDAPDYADQLRAAMDMHQPTVMLDAVAGPASAEVFFAMPEGARWVCYGRLSSEPPTLDQMAQFIFKGKKIEGFWLSRWMQEVGREKVAQTFADVQARFVSGTWHTEISDTVPLVEAMDRLPTAYSAKDSKVLIAP